MEKISSEVKYFLKKWMYLLDEHEENEFLTALWDESMNSAEVEEIFKLLSYVGSPITKEMRINHFIRTLNAIIPTAQKTSPEDWEDYYYSDGPAIDEDGDLLVYNLMQGFKLHNYGFTDGELFNIIENNRLKIKYPKGIYWG